jgi:hypothetical protein
MTGHARFGPAETGQRREITGGIVTAEECRQATFEMKEAGN